MNWFDNWIGDRPLRHLRDGQPRPPSQLISLQEAVSEELPLTGTVPVLTGGEDHAHWRWSANGIYLACSLYNTIISAGKIGWHYMELWTAAAPSKVKFFTYLLLQNRILTHEVMRRGMQCDMQCVTCDDCPIESSQHLFFECPNAVEVWGRCRNLYQHAPTVTDTWEASI